MNEIIFKNIISYIKELNIIKLQLNNNSFGNSGMCSLNEFILNNKKLMKIEMKQCKIDEDG